MAQNDFPSIPVLETGFDLDLLRQSGFYCANQPEHGPVPGAFFMTVFAGPLAGTFRCLQLACDLSNGYEYARTLTVSGWSTWNSMSGAAAGSSGVLHGAGAPNPGTGADGDFYIDTSLWYVYGPKTAGAWGSGTPMTGPQGPQGLKGDQGNQGLQGVAGNTMLNGTGAPSNGLGVNGDFYFDTAAVAIYGPKAAGAWPGAARRVTCHQLVRQGRIESTSPHTSNTNHNKSNKTAPQVGRRFNLVKPP